MDTFRDQDAAAEYARGLLRGERIRLRAATDEDLAEVERWWNDPETAVLQQASILPRPGGAVNDLLRSWSANASPGSVGFAVEEEADGSLAGHVALWGGAAPQRCGTLAVVLGPYARGRGLGTDAVRTLVRYGFAELGLHRIELRAWAFNKRARAAYRRSGFIEEGRRRDALFHAGRFHDEILMSVLAHEFPHA
ncbi:RimJ/RimL family protein N-acetyltransferase [Rathayibacter tanaceti]|uniref:GNAT family N-acetyltransferase n=2 Tax=Rathayibacter tanaceti TaxID=1671680 RepID=A0AAE6RLY3_9MICO|nr:GNAT family protein [Rathayibacter tanaceti]QHC56656.1 GNAT family N-acetyltransferase [Rathayibacter tanaceti]TCO36196.1 RimJ/RimL family protein N-acetyltransferase [Rathayibacter tanaceti]